MSDDLVELAFQIEDMFAELDVPLSTEGTRTLDHAVPVVDDEYFVYGTATPDAVEAVRTIVETLPYWKSVHFFGDGDPSNFKLRLSDPPVLSAVASLGGTVEEAFIAPAVTPAGMTTDSSNRSASNPAMRDVTCSLRVTTNCNRKVGTVRPHELSGRPSNLTDATR